MRASYPRRASHGLWGSETGRGSSRPVVRGLGGGHAARWPNATVVSSDAVDVVARLKEESKVPLRSHGSLSLNRALMAAGLVDRVQVTLFPVITGQTGLTRSSRVRPTSTWSWSSTGRSTVTSKSSSTDPPSIDLFAEAVWAKVWSLWDVRI
jgi:hypothetical protein